MFPEYRRSHCSARPPRARSVPAGQSTSRHTACTLPLLACVPPSARRLPSLRLCPYALHPTGGSHLGHLVRRGAWRAARAAARCRVPVHKPSLSTAQGGAQPCPTRQLCGCVVKLLRLQRAMGDAEPARYSCVYATHLACVGKPSCPG